MLKRIDGTAHLSHLAAEIGARLRAFARELGVVGRVDLGEVVACGVRERGGRREVSAVWYGLGRWIVSSNMIQVAILDHHSNRHRSSTRGDGADECAWSVTRA